MTDTPDSPRDLHVSRDRTSPLTDTGDSASVYDGTDLEPLAQFHGYCKGARTSDKTGELLVTIAVPLDQKYQALPITDYPGHVFKFDVQKLVLAYDGMTAEEIEAVIREMESGAGDD